MSDKPFWFDEERLALQEFEMSEQSKPIDERLLITEYDQAARVTHLYLKPWCDETIPFPAMVADACRNVREAYDALSAKCAELKEQIVRLRAGYTPTNDGWPYQQQLANQIESLRAHAQKDIDKINELRAQLSEAQGYCEELDRKNETLKREIHKMKVGQELANEHMTNLERELAEVSKRGLEWLDKCNAERSKLAELEKQLGEKDAELKDLVRLQAGEFYLVHHKSHPDPAEEFVKAFNSLRTDWLKMKAALESTASTGCYHCSGDASETLANLKYKGE